MKILIPGEKNPRRSEDGLSCSEFYTPGNPCPVWQGSICDLACRTYLTCGPIQVAFSPCPDVVNLINTDDGSES